MEFVRCHDADILYTPIVPIKRRFETAFSANLGMRHASQELAQCLLPINKRPAQSVIRMFYLPNKGKLPQTQPCTRPSKTRSNLLKLKGLVSIRLWMGNQKKSCFTKTRLQPTCWSRKLSKLLKLETGNNDGPTSPTSGLDLPSTAILRSLHMAWRGQAMTRNELCFVLLSTICDLGRPGRMWKMLVSEWFLPLWLYPWKFGSNLGFASFFRTYRSWGYRILGTFVAMEWMTSALTSTSSSWSRHCTTLPVGQLKPWLDLSWFETASSFDLFGYVGLP